MKNKISFKISIIIILFALLCIAVFEFSKDTHINELGLTSLDLALGDNPDLIALKINVQKSTDIYLKNKHAELSKLFKDSYKISVNYSLIAQFRKLGYKSSFYYYCWNIYLPYTLVTEKGANFSILLKTSDSANGYNHNPNAFRVTSAIVLDSNNQVVKEFN